AAPAYEPVPFEHPLWVLFSSGTTGLPKAIVHSQGGIILELLKSHALHSDLGPGDRYFFFCPTGWVVWNILVSGLLTGAAIVLMDGDPSYPDGAELWRTISETGATTFGCGATFLMICRQAGLEAGKTFDLARLRGMSSTGSSSASRCPRCPSRSGTTQGTRATARPTSTSSPTRRAGVTATGSSSMWTVAASSPAAPTRRSTAGAFASGRASSTRPSPT